MSFTFVVNTAWMLACQPAHRRFLRATHNVASAQQQVLQEILSSNLQSDFGKLNRFVRMKSIDDFRKGLSFTDYESFVPWINRIASGETNVLTSERIQMLEPTSGNTTARKLIPYTRSLQRQFQRGIDAWIGDLFWMRPDIRRGRAYWSITPQMDYETTAGGLKIGFDEDTQYLGLAGRLAARSVLAVRRSQLKRSRAEETLRETMRHLIAVPDLSLISVWSPTFLLSMLQRLDEDRQWLVENSLPMMRIARVHQAQRILQSSAPIAEMVDQLWPHLALVSCWTDGASSGFAGRLQQLLPGTEIQSKGLISTEAFVSFPLVGQTASVLSIRSHFYEFVDSEQETGRSYLAHEVTVGRRYHVIVTTAGGLYRYRTGDIVAVEGFINECPLIRFVGRGERVSDLVGEKLNDAFVASVITNTMRRFDLHPTFASLVPILSEQPHYCFRMDCCEQQGIDCHALRAAMDSELAQNPYYAHAIRLGQLGPLEISLSGESGPSHWQQYETQRLHAGIRRGDIKPVSLDTSVESTC